MRGCALCSLHFNKVRVVIYNHNKVISIEYMRTGQWWRHFGISCSMRGSHDQACDGCTALHTEHAITHINFISKVTSSAIASKKTL